MKIYLFFFMITKFVNSFSSNKLYKFSSFKLQDSMDYYNTKPVSIGKLMNDIENHDVSTIYFSQDLKKIYSLTNDNTKRVTVSNPILVDNLIDMSNKNNVNSIILEKQEFTMTQALGTVYNFFDFFFIGTIIILILRSLFNLGNVNQSSMNLMNNMPFSFKNIKNNNDKINMIKSNISLSSWAGSPEIFEECTEIVSYLKNSTNYKNVGAEIPKGILLEGPPGTGKTLIAKAIASEANSSFISISASEFVEVFVGLGASKVRNLFKDARENAPSIIFIDEIDAIGRQRGAGINMGNDEREQTLNQILAEMDGFTPNENVIVIGATNRKDVLDTALLRPGRFDRIINVPLPDKQSRKSILEIYLSKKNIEENINIDFLAELTAGFSGAQIKNLVNEAAINAARVSRVIITQNDIKNALEKIVIGIIKKVDNRTHESKTRVALHEIGHGFLAWYFKEYFELQKISIQSTYNGVGGFTIFNEYPDITESGLYTKDILKKRIIIALGGKAAEEVFYGDSFVSLGASQDLKQANSIAQKMIGNYGMGDDLKIFYNENIDNNNPFLGRSLGTGNKYSEMIKEIMDRESLNLVNECYKEAYNLIDKNKKNIGVISNILIESITLDSAFVNNFFKE